MKLNYSKKIFIMSVLLLLLILIFNIIFLYLLFSKIESVNNKVKQLNISTEKRATDFILKDSVLSLSEEREKLSNYFIGMGDKETIDFTKYIEDLADSLNITQQKTLSLETIPNFASSETVSAIRYKINVSGPWSNVYHFILLMENIPKVTFLKSISLNTSLEASSLKEIKKNNRIWNANLDFVIVKSKI